MQTSVATTYLLSTTKMHICKSDVLCRDKRRATSLVPLLSGPMHEEELEMEVCLCQEEVIEADFYTVDSPITIVS